MLFNPFVALLLVVTCCHGAKVSDWCRTNKETTNDFVKCLSWKTFATDEESISADIWLKMQPTTEERQAFHDVVTSMLTEKDCMQATIPSALTDKVTIKTFKDSCVLMESETRSDMAQKIFMHGWPMVFVRNIEDGVRRLHQSAPHHRSDYNTDCEAAAMFDLTKSRSLVVSTLNRYSCKAVPNACDHKYSVSDAGHNAESMFHTAVTAVYDAEGKTNCEKDKCAFVQWHGKGRSTCKSDHAFVSVGMKANDIYADESQPVFKIVQNFHKVFPAEYKMSTPNESDCFLTATTNTFGRYINGVQDVCHGYNAKSANGKFIHIEQLIDLRYSKIKSTQDQMFELWAEVLNKTYKTNEQ
jgi:hypothetical protein